MRRGLLTAALLLPAALALTQEAAPPPSVPAAEPVSSPAKIVCRYCRVPREADDFCFWCGRLSGTATAPANRFWGDVPYVLHFPPGDSPPSIAAEFSDRGLASETVSFPSGDRYIMTMGKQGPEVEGHVDFGKTAKESVLHATVKDTIEGGHLLVRKVHGKLSGELDYHLYRKLDYLYTADGLLDTIRFGTWFYAGASDWEKKPGSWRQHAVGEIVMVREAGRLVRVETSYHEGRRSLRGESEYEEAVVTVESVRRAADGAIDRLVATARQ